MRYVGVGEDFGIESSSGQEAPEDATQYMDACGTVRSLVARHSKFYTKCHCSRRSLTDPTVFLNISDVGRSDWQALDQGQHYPSHFL
jgi:hypothetical protein